MNPLHTFRLYRALEQVLSCFELLLLAAIELSLADAESSKVRNDKLIVQPIATQTPDLLYCLHNVHVVNMLDHFY